MDRNADYIIIGGGVIGCSTAYHLAQQGAKNVVLLERGELASGGTAKSCAIVRTHYSIETNLNHAVESLRVFSQFDDLVGGDAGWRRTGYLILGPEAHREPMLQVFARQNARGIDTRVLSPEEAAEMHPLLYYGDAEVIGYDSQAGYADPYLTTTSYAARAKSLGVAIHTGTAVTGLALDRPIKMVEINGGAFHSPVVILAAGPWTNALVGPVGLEFPYEISRHKVITLKIDRPYEPDWPIVKDLTTPDKIYFRPAAGGVVLVGTGDHGDPIEDADALTDHIDADHLARIGDLIAHRMPPFADAQNTAGWTGPYDISADWNPIVGAVPGYEGLYVAVGFSGHGFKLAPTIGESLAQAVLGHDVRVPIDDYGIERFAEGHALRGAYGIGSIS
jgi:glycine/D-amino acid oxidase-like deaminating enzyme